MTSEVYLASDRRCPELFWVKVLPSPESPIGDSEVGCGGLERDKLNRLQAIRFWSRRCGWFGCWTGLLCRYILANAEELGHEGVDAGEKSGHGCPPDKLGFLAVL